VTLAASCSHAMYGFLFGSLVVLFDDSPATELHTLSLHDALPISPEAGRRGGSSEAGVESVFRCRGRARAPGSGEAEVVRQRPGRDRKSTRLNSSHVSISYAVFCLKKKKKKHTHCANEYNETIDRW